MAVPRIATLIATVALIVGCTAAPLGTAGPPESPLPSSAAPTDSPLPTTGASTATPAAPATDPPMVTASPTAVVATPTPTPTPTATPSPTPTPTVPATPRPSRIRSFEGPQTVDCNVSPEPSSVHLAWEIARAQGVSLSIDGPGIYDTYPGMSGEGDFPFGCGEPRHRYLLRTYGGDGAADSQEIVIRRARPRILEFSPSYVGPNGGLCNYRFVWRVDNAMGVRIFILGNEYGSYSGREGDITVPYNCPSGDRVTYRLETTGMYGPHASEEVEAPYP